MFKKLLLALLVLIVALLAWAWTRPDTYAVERSAHIDATPQQVYALVGDFRNWPQWSPWEHLDPGMQRVLSMPSSGVGASYAWQGNKDAGKGRMQFTEANPPQHLALDLDFIEPFPSNNTMRFAFTPDGIGTQVTWSMLGKHSFMTKLMGVFMSFDTLIGKDFEQGLQNLTREADKVDASHMDAIEDEAAVPDATPAAEG